MSEYRDDYIKETYFNYLCDMIHVNGPSCDENAIPYRCLCRILFDKDFYWSIPTDENRAIDGCGLREPFILCQMDQNFAASKSSYASPDDFDTNSYIWGHCNLLEMLVALACRIEDDLMYDPGEENRTSRWFVLMLKNLALDTATDDAINEEIMEDVYHKLEIFLDRTYDSCGNGSLWPLGFTSKDMREVEIWYQMQYFFSERSIEPGEFI